MMEVIIIMLELPLAEVTIIRNERYSQIKQGLAKIKI